MVIVSGTDDVIATYQGNSASFSNDLYVTLSIGGSETFIFNNHANSPGDTMNLGSFLIGTELIFRMHVNNTGYDFYTGDASRNPDGQAHARVQTDWLPNETLVSFEDLFNGPFNFNDLSFSFTNTTSVPPNGPVIPEPTGALLFGIGLIAVSRSARISRARVG